MVNKMETNTQLIYGKNTVLEALKNGSVKVLYLEKEQNYDVKELALKSKVEIKYLTKIEMNKMVNGNHQGCIALTFDYKYYQLDDVITDKNDSLIIALDGLEDPHNLGAIIRTAEISGCDGIILPKNRSVRVSSSVFKVSTGAIEYVKVAQVTNLRQTLQELKKKGYWIVGAEYTPQSQEIWDVDYNMKICLVIGSEGNGISRIVREECDYLVKIPMWGKINSLNASVSAAIIIYEIRRQQNKK